MLLYASGFGVMLPRLENAWLSRLVTESVQRHAPCPQPLVATTGYAEPSVVFMLGTDTVTGHAEAVATRLAASACGLAVVRADRVVAFRAASAALGVTPIVVDRIDGFNYSTGRALSLLVFTRADREDDKVS